MIEVLETRRLFAVVVTEGFPGFYEATGDAADDVVGVVVDQAARTITVNGVVYGHASFLNVYGLGGNDTINVASVGGAVPVGVGVRGGDGADAVTLSNVGGGVWGGSGNDRIELNDSFRAQAYGEDGNDMIVLRGDCADADVRGGGGNDTLNGQESTVPVVLFGDAGWDRLYGSPLADILDGGAGRDYLFGRDGNDQFYARDGDLDYVIGGNGIDTVISDASEMNTSGVEVILPP